MENSVTYALDFDGVICDSAVETGITAWKAATHLWDDMQGKLPKQVLLDQFRITRPIIETGYEAILVMRMLFEEHSTVSILANFSEKKQLLLQQSDQDIPYLKQLFGQTRDNWITQALEQWIEMNPLFPGVAEKLIKLNEQNLWYVITTKQERFVKQILAANQIELPADRIFGLDRNMSKVEVLSRLMEQHPGNVFHFVEDRLPTLLEVLKHQHLEQVKLSFACWGYNTEQDKSAAKQQPFESIDLNEFLGSG